MGNVTVVYYHLFVVDSIHRSNIDVSMNLICRFCGKKAKSARLMVELLDSEIDEDTPEPSLLQKIDACIPIKVSKVHLIVKNSYKLRITSSD